MAAATVDPREGFVAQNWLSFSAYANLIQGIHDSPPTPPSRARLKRQSEDTLQELEEVNVKGVFSLA